MSKKVTDVFSVALLVFFLGIMLAGLYSLGRMHSSPIALDAAVVGIVGTLVSLFVAVTLILSDDQAEGE